MAFVTIRVDSDETGDVLYHESQLRLPLTCGRDQQKIVSIPSYQRLSRHHFDLEEIDGAIYITDRSRNGMYHRTPRGDEPLPLNHAYRLSAGNEVFHTVGLTISIIPGPARQRQPREPERPVKHYPTSLNVNYNKRDGTPRSVEIGPAALAMVVKSGAGGTPAYSLKIFRNCSAEDLATDLRQRQTTFALVVGPAESGAVLIAGTETADVRRNRAAVPQGSWPLQHFDTIAIGNLFLHIVDPQGPRGLECVNPDCRQLNSYDPRTNCSWCGTLLGGAYTMRK